MAGFWTINSWSIDYSMCHSFIRSARTNNIYLQIVVIFVTDLGTQTGTSCVDTTAWVDSSAADTDDKHDVTQKQHLSLVLANTASRLNSRTTGKNFDIRHPARILHSTLQHLSSPNPTTHNPLHHLPSSITSKAIYKLNKP